MEITTGLTANGLPLGRMSGGPADLVLLNGGPDFSHKPMKRFAVKMMLRTLKPLTATHTLYIVTRRRGMTKGSTVDDIADDAAQWIRDELRPPVDLAGLSSGGSYALPLAANHPELVRTLAIIESAARLGDQGREIHRMMGDAMTNGRPRAIFRKVMGLIYQGGVKGTLMGWMGWLIAPVIAGKPVSSDIEGGWIEVEAEKQLDFRSRLGEIKCPAVVMGAANDPQQHLSACRLRAWPQAMCRGLVEQAIRRALSGCGARSTPVWQPCHTCRRRLAHSPDGGARNRRI